MRKSVASRILFVFFIALSVSCFYISKQIELGERALAAGRLQLIAGEKAITVGKLKLEKGEIALAQGKAALFAGKKALFLGRERLATGEKIYNKVKLFPFGIIGDIIPIPPIRHLLQVIQDKVSIGRESILNGQAEVANGEKAVIAGEREVSAGEKRLVLGYQQLKAGEHRWALGRQAYLNGKEKLIMARKMRAILLILSVVFGFLFVLIFFFSKERPYSHTSF